jgi:hypothetical protein
MTNDRAPRAPLVALSIVLSALLSACPEDGPAAQAQGGNKPSAGGSTDPSGKERQGSPSSSPWEGPSYGSAFGDQWYDGQAELAGYTLTFPRYGELRTDGTAVAIFVSEHFLNEARVKANQASDDTVPVLKLNLVLDFQTGIYDYNLMTSAFVATKPVNGLPAGAPTKVSFSSQEWCGHVYHQSLFDASGVRDTQHSYFEGEADERRELEHPSGGFSEDALLLWARGIAGPALEPGATAELPLYRSLEIQRLQHVPAAWDSATLERHEGTERVEVPAGEFEVERRTAEVKARGDGPDRTWTFYVEASRPHRIVRFTRDDGLDARMTGAERMPYWKLNGKGQAERLQALGLSRRPPRTP